ncbi:serine/threonine-protein kinase [Dactylosporangium sp. NPDC051485]|uniref:serine/threonine-protein kinase n=1 Tax=Dactylosporangium sp. NPDC051485 TaxID=3154846 RepID=UPI0034399898
MHEWVLGGRYHLEDVLGVGGMSTVWRGRDEVLGRKVAVKLLSGPHSADAGARQRIRVEARAAAALAHPNVAQVYDFGETVQDGNRTPYVVMELVPGPTLEQRVRSPLSPVAALRICAEVAAGLAAAHADGMVHRDVKPANIILAPTGAKVVDFGIAAAAGPARGVLDNEILGTPDYLAPERLTDDAVTPASDVYSLGVLLYRLLAGRLPWVASGPTELLDAHLHRPPAPLPTLSDVPPEVAELYQRCLSKAPTARPTAAEVATALAEAAGIRAVTDDLAHAVAPPARDGGPSTVLVRPAAPTAAARRRGARPAAPAAAARRRRFRPAVGVLAGVAIVVAAAWIAIPQPARHTSAEAGRQASAASESPAPAVTDAGPSGAGGTTASALPEPASPGPAQTFISTGGAIEARCAPAGLAEILSSRPKSPWKADWVNAGPADAATAAFAHGNTTIDMTVTCRGPDPSVVTTTHGK